MTTGTAGDTGQRYVTNQTHYLAKTVTYASLGTSNTIKVGDLPPGHIVLRGGVFVVTGFNDTNGDDLDVGVEGGDDDLFASGLDLNTGTATVAFDDLADANRRSTSARTVTCNLTTAASGNGSAGEAIVYLEYMVIRD